jgi:hypothetical protein
MLDKEAVREVLMNGSTMGVYQIFSVLCDMYPDLREEYNKVRYGFDVKFDIYDYYNGRMTIKSKSGLIAYRGATCPESVVNTELEKRKTAMLKVLLAYSSSGSAFVTRVNA